MSPLTLICKVVLSVTVCTAHGTLGLTTHDAAAILAPNQTQIVLASRARDYWYPSERRTTRATSAVTVNVNIAQPYDLRRDLIARGLRLPHETFGALVTHLPRNTHALPPVTIKRKQ